MEENFINVVDANGNNYTVEVLDIFGVEGFDKDYILYTMNKEIDEENIETYVSILKENDGNFSLEDISDDNEWDVVQRAILEMGV